jgi:hypothetical protein
MEASMTYADRMSNFTIETEQGDLFVFEYRDLNIKREDQTGVFNFQDDIPFVQKNYHGAEKHSYELYLSGDDYDIAAANFWEATKAKTPLTLKYPSRDKAVNAQIMSIEQINNHATSENEVGFIVDILESSILDKAPEDTTRQAYISQQYKVVQEANSKFFYQELPVDTNVLEKAKNTLKDATAAINKTLTAYDYATDTLADLKSIERTASGLVDTIETNGELFSQAFQGYIEFAVNALDPSDMINFMNDLMNEFDIFSQDTDDNTKLMTSIAFSGGLILASTQTTADIYTSKLEVYAQSQLIFDFYEKIIEVADLLEINTDLIILLNGLINLTAAKLEAISFQARQQRTYELKIDSEIYTLVYKLIPCANSDELETEVERFISTNKIGGKELFELKAGRKLKYYL